MKRRRAIERQLRLSYAPKVAIGSIVRLYRADAAGIHDDELLTEVGWRLYERCTDILLISDAQVRCPACTAVFAIPWRGQPAGSMALCSGCGWRVSASEYRNSWRGLGLQGPNARAVWGEYVTRYPVAETYQERILLIDRLVHGVHTSGNLAARNLFEGSPHQVLAALNALADTPTQEPGPA